MRATLRRIAAAGAIVLSCSSGVVAQTGRVSGIVRDDSNEPIKGATVTAENEATGASTAITATTDERGRFTIIGLRGGAWRFFAQAPGHSSAVAPMNVRFGSPNPALALTLRRNGPAPDAPLGRVSARDLQSALGQADALFNGQKWDEAIAAYRAILARTPALTVINLQIAAAHRAKGDHAGALAAYNALLAADPVNEKAMVGIAATHLARGDAPGAEAVLAPAVASERPGPEVLFTMAELKQAAGDPAAAAQFFERAAAADPSWGKPLYGLGVLAMKRGDAATAARFMERVTQVDPLSPESAQARATLTELGR